jgi:hypothetical protein
MAGCGFCSVGESYKEFRFSKSGFFLRFGCRVFWLVKLAAVEFIETLLPKIEFVVKCSQDSRGSGLWSRSLAQPENA